MGRLRIPPDDDWIESRITLRVSYYLHQALIVQARTRGLSMNELGSRILHQFLAAQEAEPVDRDLDATKRSHRENLDQLRRRLDDLPPDRRPNPDWA